jgi:hypothetical protein
MQTILTQPPKIDPAVWRPETPLIVDELCDTPEQVAVWRAIRWLLAAYPNRRGFGTREIEKRAKVSRKKVKKIVDKLAAKGLIEIVGYEYVGFPTPRPIYSIDLKRLERDSNDMTAEVLLNWHIYDPPPPPPAPNQMDMFTSGAGVDTHGPVSPHAHGPVSPHAPSHGAGVDTHGPVSPHAHGQDWNHVSSPPEPAAASEIHPSDTESLHAKKVEHGADVDTHGPVSPHAHGQDWDHLEGGKEGRKEGENHTPAESLSITELIRRELQQTLSEFVAETFKTSAAAPELSRMLAPGEPEGEPEINHHPLDLWRDIYPEPRLIELRQLEALAQQHDIFTGHGEYWVARAILAAALVNEHPGIHLVKYILDRWHTTASYGSDSPAYEQRNGNGKRYAVADQDQQPVHGAEQHQQQPVLADELHPAVSLYIERTGQQPNSVQVDSMGTITDLSVWGQVLNEWLANGWNLKAVAKMLDAYGKRTGAVPAAEERVSSLEIDMADIDGADKGVWSNRFRDAPTAAEKRKVIDRFRQWLAEQQQGEQRE